MESSCSFKLLFLFLHTTLKPILLTFLLLTLVASCSHKRNEAPQLKPQPSSKQADWVMALTPTLDALPFFVAQQAGIYDSLGLKLRIDIYNSQMNAEQALTLRKADLCSSDLFRCALLQSRRESVRMLFGTSRQWLLVANKALRVNKISQISSRMVGMTRHSVPAYICDYLRTQMSTAKGPMLTPQINSIVIREKMLAENQIDAALLPQPQALLSCMKGNTMLFRSGSRYDGYSGIAIHGGQSYIPSTPKKIALLRKGYNMAVCMLQKSDTLTISIPVAKLFGLEGLTSRIHPKQYFSSATDFKEEKINTAVTWMKKQGALHSHYRGDTLIYR